MIAEIHKARLCRLPRKKPSIPIDVWGRFLFQAVLTVTVTLSRCLFLLHLIVLKLVKASSSLFEKK